jgi:hypothetical protein
MKKIKSIEFKRDVNGNKTLSIKFEGHRAFSIQTLGNLPIAHASTFGDVDSKVFAKIESEVEAYLSQFGTRNQKQIAGLR